MPSALDRAARRRAYGLRRPASRLEAYSDEPRAPPVRRSERARRRSGRDDGRGHRPRTVDDRAACVDRLRLVEARLAYSLAADPG